MTYNTDPLKSASPCGCDEGAGWVCERHQEEFAQFEEDHLGVQPDFCAGCGEKLPNHTELCKNPASW